MSTFELPRSGVDVERLLSERQWVQRLARSLVVDPNQADDVAQESWLTALRHPPQHDANLKSWLSRLVRNTAAAFRRSDTRRCARERSVMKPAVTSGSSEALERAEVVRELVDAVLALDPARRQALVLVYFEGLAPNAAANRLGIPHSTFRTHVRRGLAEVRERLERKRERKSWLPALIVLAGRPEVIGVTLMKKSLVAVAAIVLIAVVIGVRQWNTESGAPVIAQRVPVDSLTPSETTALTPATAPDTAATTRHSAAHAAPLLASTLTVAAVWDSNGAPIADLLVAVRRMDGSEILAERVARTTQDGDVTFDVTGWTKFWCISERGGDADAQLDARTSHTVELRVPANVRVRGRVLGERDEPVFGAAVYTSTLDLTTPRAPLCTTDGDGRFDAGLLSRQLSVFAEHPRLGGSAHYQLYNTKLDELDLLIRMQGTGHALAGTVVDTQGAPVERARVRISAGSSHWAANVADVYVSAAYKFAFTDENGGFTFSGLPRGPGNLRTERLGFGDALTGVELAGPITEVKVVLQPAVQVFGVVRDSSGAPVPEARLSLAGLRQLRSGDDGSFEWLDIPPGSHRFEVTTRNSGSLFGTLDVPGGPSFEWNPVVLRGLALAGRVVDENGKPLTGWFLRSASITNMFTEDEFDVAVTMNEDRAIAVTDADGRFEFTNCTSGERRITVAPPERGANGLPWCVANVVPGRTDVELRVDTQLAGATVRGRVEDEAGTPIGGARIVLAQSTNYVVLTLLTISAEPSGAFEFSRILPGKYELHVLAKGLCAATREIEVDGAGLVVDPIRLVRGGSIVVALSPEDAALVRGRGASLTLANTTREFKLIGDEARLDDVEPGAHTIKSETRGARPRPGPSVDVSVRPGETVRANLDLSMLHEKR